MTLDGESINPGWEAYKQQLKSTLWAATAEGSLELGKTNDSLYKIREELVAVRDKYIPSLNKTANSLRKLKEEVVDVTVATTGLLSTGAQFLIEQEIERAESDLRDIVSDHRSVHTAISKSGKDIDRYLGKNLSQLFKGQKDLDQNEVARKDTSELICKHIHTSGYTKASEELVKEAQLDHELEEVPEDRMDLEALTYYMKERDLRTLTEWVMKNDEGNYALRADLDKLKVLKLVKEGDKKAAIQFVQEMRARLDNDPEFMEIFLCVWIDPKKEKMKYKLPFLIDVVQKRICYALTYEQCLLPYLVWIGVESIPKLMLIRQHVDKRPEFLFSGEEFPMALFSECDGHCTVNCPILRQQVTKDNPAVRISCGHVMSKDAVTKLSAQSRYRGVNRIKCPYCPSESTIEQAQELVF